jgi:hypothetical protein
MTQTEQDYEDFLCEVETDKDLRAQINLFKNMSVGAEAPAEGGGDGMGEDEDEEGLEQNPDAVDINELLDEMALGLDEGGDADTGALGALQEGKEEEEDGL